MSSATESPAAVLGSEHRDWLAKVGPLLGIRISTAPGPDVDGVQVNGTTTEAPKADSPKATGAKASFKVTDKESGAPIGKANVRVGSRTSQTDDANGVCQIGVDADGASFLIQKDGFQDVTGKVDAKASEQPVQLEKEPAFNPPPESKQPTLRKGMNSADGWVEYLQKLLNKIFGPGTVAEDGNFDQKTEDAVKKFQGSTTPPCLQDGVVGNETWSMLRKGKREAVGVNKKGEEKGAEGRWATEKNDFVSYDPGSDELRMVVVSVGESPLDNFKATFRITSQDQKVKKQFLRELGAPTTVSPTGSGHLHTVIVQQMSVIYNNGEHKVESFLDEELGGDLWTGTVKVAGPGPGPGPSPTTKTGKLNVLVVSSEDDSPIPKANVTVAPAPSPPAPASALTGNDGKANLDGVAVGSCTITAESDGAVGTVDVQILENQTTSVTLTITPNAPDPNRPDVPKKPAKPDDKPRKVTIKAVDAAGKEIPNVTLNVEGLRETKDPPDEPMLALTAITNTKGTANFFLPPRSYRIKGSATGFDKVSGSFPISAKPDKPLELKMKKSEIPVTSIELIISPDRASQTTEAITFTAKVSLRDKTITPVGQVIFESKNFGTLIPRKDLVKGEAKSSIPRMGKGKQFFRATFQPTPPVTGVEKCDTGFIPHMVFDKIKELEFNEFYKTFKSKIGDALASARNFDPKLKAQRDAIASGKAEIEKLAKASDFEHALVKAKDLVKPVDEYLVDADKENKKFVDRGNQYDKRLQGANDKAKEALKIAKELKTDPLFLQHLPIGPRNEILTELQKKPFTDEKKKAVKVLMSVTYLDAGFEKRNQENADKLSDQLRSDPDYKVARDNWQQDAFGGSSGDAIARRLKIMQKAVDAYAAAFQLKNLALDPSKYKPPKVVGKRPSLPFPDKTETLADYDDAKNLIEMNVHDTAFKQRSFEEALDSVIHETGHHQQALLAKKFKGPPKMPPTDPDFNQAQSFKLNEGFYVQPPDPPPSVGKGDEYFTQPEENHSRITGGIVAAAGVGK